jgi:gliding motility-associated-like protein
LEQDPPPTASFTPNPSVGNAPLNVTFINNSQGGSNFIWDFDNGLGANTTQSNNQSTLYNEEGVYLVSLIVTEGACSDTAYQTVVVNLVLPLSFDTPNIFTPNNDGSNDVFTLNGVNVETLELVILNRWGNVVFESTDINAAWNGTNNNTGNECSDGVYFYKYIITGQGDQEAEGHGFVHLAR